MNKTALIILLACLIGCTNKHAKTKTDSFRILVDKDITNVSSFLTSLDTITTDPDWVNSDKLFYGFWLKGAQSELQGHFQAAIQSYSAGLNVKRFEMSNYEIKLPLGRALLQSGNKTEAKIILKQYQQSATNDLNNEDVEWILSEKGKFQLKKSLAVCERLILLCEQ